MAWRARPTSGQRIVGGSAARDVSVKFSVGRNNRAVYAAVAASSGVRKALSPQSNSAVRMRTSSLRTTSSFPCNTRTKAPPRGRRKAQTWVECLGKRGKSAEIGEQDRDLTTFAGRRAGRWRRRRSGRGGPRDRPDRRQQSLAVPERGDAELLQVRVGQSGENRKVDVVLGERSRVLPKSQGLQPSANIHPPTLTRISLQAH
jgi:hypothetical protein